MEEKILTSDEAKEVSQMVLANVIFNRGGHFEVPIEPIFDWLENSNPQISIIVKNGIIYFDVTDAPEMESE